jgi:hypothetical protein
VKGIKKRNMKLEEDFKNQKKFWGYLL